MPKSTKNTKTKAEKIKHSQSYIKASELIDKNKQYSTTDAIELAKKTARTKFDGTIEAHFTLNRKEQKFSLTLPNPLNVATKRILVFGQATAGTNIILASETTISDIREGKMVPGKDFDVVIATPEAMPMLAQVAKTLGPKGMMPNPKNGTITDKPDSAIKNMSAGQIYVKTQPEQPVLHVAFGKSTWEDTKILENFETLSQSIGKDQIKRVFINATMGPSIQVKI